MKRILVSGVDRRVLRAALSTVACAGLLLPALPSVAEVTWSYREVRPPAESRQPTPPGLTALVLDDGSAEGAVGISGPVAGTARQFLWLNSFTVPGLPFDVHQVWVQFPADPIVHVGGAIQLALWLDTDGNPANGAELLATVDEVVQADDGATFSVYTLDPPVRVGGPGRLLVGVVDRFVTSDVTPLGYPASLDTSSSAGRSWLAVYGGDPPDPPTLPAEALFTLVDDFQPGNWMIRAYGQQVLTPGIPALGGRGLLVLVVSIAAAGALLALRRGR